MSSVAVFLAGLALGWLSGVVSGVVSGGAWLLWALKRKSDDLARLREETER